jgi:hypothetical protein
MKKYISAFAFLLLACNEYSPIEGITYYPNSSTTSGQVIFWTESWLGGTAIDITIDAKIAGTVDQTFAEGPACGAPGAATVTLQEGTYEWSGMGANETPFYGIVTVTSKSCTKVEITPANIGLGPLTGETVVMKCLWTGGLLTIYNNKLVCTYASQTAPTAQWVIKTVSANSTNVTVMNKSTGAFLSMDNASMLSTDPQSLGSQWVEELDYQNNFYSLKNAGSPAFYLNIQTGQVSSTPIFPWWLSAHWELTQL